MTKAAEARTERVQPNWTEHRREQLRLWASLSLREQLAAAEKMGELARRARDARGVRRH